MRADFAKLRAEMLKKQLKSRGISDPLVLSSMGKVPREDFVPAMYREHAYADGPLPIGAGQTISQPYIVAVMTEAAEVKPGDRVLEVGTGSGYGAAVLAEMGASVVTIERLSVLADRAREQLAQYEDVEVVEGDGSLGWAKGAPYQAILVTAGAPAVPKALLRQLAPGGRLVIPEGDALNQQLVCYRGGEGKEVLDWVRFVPLIGEEGWG